MGLLRPGISNQGMGKGMSKLQLLHRPWVVFDPHNEHHRKYYSEFVQYRTWGRCPVRFFVDDDSGDLITMMQRKLVDFYVIKEFPSETVPDTNKFLVNQIPK